MRALEEVTLYHQIETNVPVKNFLNETRQYLGNHILSDPLTVLIYLFSLLISSLGKMIRILNVSEDVMVMVTLVSDVAYAREIVYEYIPQMQVRPFISVFSRLMKYDFIKQKQGGDKNKTETILY